jgi:hypothetical protein
MKEYIIDSYSQDGDILFASGLDEAILGFDPISFRVVYSRAMCVEVMSRDMSQEGAIEYLQYNTFNAFVGDKTPIWVDDFYYD